MPSTLGPIFSMEVTVPAEWQALSDDKRLQVMDRNGFGWTLEVPHTLFRQQLVERAQVQTRLFIAQVLREDAEQLYAFEHIHERRLFVELRDLDSIGPKLAALIVAEVPVAELRALASSKGKTLSRKIPGLGPKMQEKLIHALQMRKERFLSVTQAFLMKDGDQDAASASYSAGLSGASGQVTLLGQPPRVLVQSLESLGLREADVASLWGSLTEEDKNFSQSTQAEQLTAILKEWGRSRSQKGKSSFVSTEREH